jgi:hypothetical protein
LIRNGAVTYEEGVLDVGQNGVLRNDVIDLAKLDDIRLL